MSGPVVDPFADASALANRIAQHLKAHPNDRQARDDLRYVVSQLKAQAPASAAADNPPEASTGAQVAAGLASVPPDLVKGTANALMHPIRTLGQLSGLANLEAWKAARQDPDLSIPEKLDAFVRATPFNAGYAPGRAFLESTGMKSDEAAPLSEQVRQGGDLAATLLLARYGGPAGKRLGRAGNAAAFGIPGRIMDALLNRKTALPTEPVAPGLPKNLTPHVAAGPLEDVSQALADYKAGRISPQDLNTAMEYAGQQMGGQNLGLAPSPQAAPDALDVPTFMRRAPPESPLAQTPAEEAATAATKALRGRAREAARAAFNRAVAAGQSLEEANIAARWAATHVGLLAQ